MSNRRARSVGTCDAHLEVMRMPVYTDGAALSEARLEKIVAYLSAYEIEQARRRGESDPMTTVKSTRFLDGRTTIQIDIAPREQQSG